MASSWPWAEFWVKLGKYSSQEKGNSCVCCLWDYSFNIACTVNSAVIKPDLCHNLLYSPLLKTCLWAVRERWIVWMQNQLTVKTRTYLFPHRRISKLNIFFLLILKKMFSFVNFPCSSCSGRHWCITYAMVLQLFLARLQWVSPLCILCRSVHPDPGKCCRPCLLSHSKEGLL